MSRARAGSTSSGAKDRAKDRAQDREAAQSLEGDLRREATRAGNRSCCECAQRGPTYVDLTTGSFVCSRCSGLLRGLTPPHRVKSISMATFTSDEIEQIKKQGNDYCKARWLGLYEGQPPVFKDEQTLKDYLSDVYEKKRYYLDDGNAVAKQVWNASNYNNNNNAKHVTAVQKNVTPKETQNLWNSNIERPSPVRQQPPLLAPKPNISFAQPVQHQPNRLVDVFSSPVPATQSSTYPNFPVDFSSADIYNSSQTNNNVNFQFTNTNKTFSPSFGIFDTNKNSNAVSQDRYAALADLDFEFRQQHHAQEPVKFPSSANPFDANNGSSAISKNPFHAKASMMNGNAISCSNPFMMGPSVTGHSKNPFL